MVSFDEFWCRAKKEFAKWPVVEPNRHAAPIRKWSQHSGQMSGEFLAVWEGGNVIYCTTDRTKSVRTVSRVEFEKVYGAWSEYRAGRKGRSFIAHDLGVQNASWIILILFRYEYLMN